MRAGRRVIAAVVLALWACGDGSTGPEPVARVDVSPPAATLIAGQTVTLAGTARDSDGRALSDRTLTWTSENSSFATVSASGAVIGLAPGTTDVTATADGVNGKATVTVLPPPVATISVLPAQVSLLPGETQPLTATARDAQGGVLTSAAFTWISNDVSVATVDHNGLVTSRAPGAATIYATAGGRSGSSAVGVDDPAAPRVLSIAPPELLEGQAATLTGTNFSAVAAENVVTVDGVRATVSAASTTSLDIVVPALACRPRHTADVAVTVGARTGHSSFPALPASSFQLAQGELVLLRDPSAYCLQFAATAADEQYLIGVQSNAITPSTLTFAQITSERDAAAPPPASPSPSMSVLTAPAVVGGDRDILPRPEWRSRHAEILERDIEQARLLPRPAPGAGPQRTNPRRIPGNVTVGDTVTIRYPDLDAASTCQSYVDVQGTVRFVGSLSILVSDDANPLGGYTDADYASLGTEFDAQVYPHQTAYFGSPTDADGNGRVVGVITKEVNADGIGGVVPSVNLYPRGTCAGSNEGEYFFIFAPDPAGEYRAGAITATNARSAATVVAGHELVHNIHLSRRFAAGHDFWTSWMHEGQATLGEEVLGHHLSPPRGPGQNYGWSVVRNDPPTVSRRWYYDMFRHLFLYYGWNGQGAPFDPGGTKVANAPEGCSWLDSPAGTNAGVCANRGLLAYGVTWSFLRWLTDHYSADFPGGEAEMHTAWIDGTQSGFLSFEALVGEEMETLLASWAASLYLDDRVTGLDPLLTFPSYDLLDIESHVSAPSRLEPRVRAFDDFTQSVQVRAGSTAYFLVSGANRASTAIRVRSPTGGFLSPTIQLWVARVR